MPNAITVRAGRLTIGLAIITIGVFEYVVPESQVLFHNILQHLYVVPIGIAGLYFGWRGGLAAALTATAVLTPHLLDTIGKRAWTQAFLVTQVAEIIDMFLGGLLIGMFADTQRRHKQALERTTRQLSTVYQELQENFERQKRSERLYAIGQLSAGLAHEIRNPLASIAGATGILQRNQASPERQSECLEIINRECQRLTRLLTNFLDFARPRDPQYQRVDVASILDPVLELASHAIDRRPITLRKQIASGVSAIECDPEQLKQVLLNLMINAIQAMPQGGEVVVSALSRNGKAVIEVMDQGYGIEAEHMERIFDPFFTTKESGTGLGLSVAHQIIGQHGGILTAVKNAGRGMTFRVTLPFERRTIS